MSSSEDSKPPMPTKKPPRREELQASLAMKLAAMDPNDRDLLLRLEGARRGLPIARTRPGGQGLADVIAVVPDDRVAAVAARIGIRASDRTPQELRTSMLLCHEDQVRAAIAAEMRPGFTYPPPLPEEIHTGGPHTYSTYSPPSPYRDESTDPVMANRLGAELMR